MSGKDIYKSSRHLISRSKHRGIGGNSMFGDFQLHHISCEIGAHWLMGDACGSFVELP